MENKALNNKVTATLYVLKCTERMNSLSIDEAKEQIERLQQFIELVEAYYPETLEQHVIKLYIIHENVTTVMKLVNDMGFRIGNRKLVTTDVSDVLRAKPMDELHEIASKFYKKNRRKVSSFAW